MSFSFNNWFPNLVFGTLRPDTINGTDRRDIIVTFGGNDTIAAGSGDDIVDAGAGDDAIEGGEGDDIVNGGRGFDTAIYTGTIEGFDIALPGRWSNTVTVRDLSNGDADRLTGIEALYFGADDYTFYLDGRNNAVLARDDIFSTDENTALVLAAADLTANDSESTETRSRSPACPQPVRLAPPSPSTTGPSATNKEPSSIASAPAKR